MSSGKSGNVVHSVVRRFAYYDDDSVIWHIKERLEPKAWRNTIYYPDGREPVVSPVLYPSIIGKPLLYRHPETMQHIRSGGRIVLTEGERDAETLHQLGIPATTFGSGFNWHTALRQYLLGADIVIWFDSDFFGTIFRDKIQAILSEWSNVHVVNQPNQYKDITEFYSAHEDHFLTFLASLPL